MRGWTSRGEGDEEGGQATAFNAFIHLKIQFLLTLSLYRSYFFNAAISHISRTHRFFLIRCEMKYFGKLVHDEFPLRHVEHS